MKRALKKDASGANLMGVTRQAIEDAVWSRFKKIPIGMEA